MSEEILKALMQLFAIIAKQDNGSGEQHSNYVLRFLGSQISDDRIPEYIEYYKSFLGSAADPEEKARRTSMKDSVRTLSICKKINKTLNQKQKVIVFVRLYEFILQDKQDSALRNEILKTVAEVFNIPKEEFNAIALIFFTDYTAFTPQFLLVHEHNLPDVSCRQMEIPGFQGLCIFHFIVEFNIIIMMYRGETEVTLNGLALKPGQVNMFSPGSLVRHARGTLFYSDVVDQFLDEAYEGSVRISATIRMHRHPNGKPALQQMHVDEKSGTLVGIMGASGSGKTTLLNVLSGNDIVSDGQVLINDFDLHKDHDQLKGVIGFIPQDDLLIEELTVFQNLFLSARLCFKHIMEKELNIKVMKLLHSLGLNETKDIKVGNPLNKKISGGQRKRLNIALELIREPQILFVDEPTSGLSSKDSENVMDLLKELSHKGKLIFVVIHQPSSDIYKLFDKIFLLDVGGYPVYYGNPVEALMYFKRMTNQVNSNVAECHSCGSVNPELIFNLVEAKEIDEYGNYTSKRKISPARWNELYRENFPPEENTQAQKTGQLKISEIPSRIRQWWIFLRRDCLSKISNRQYILINLLEVPVLAMILSMLVRYTNRYSGARVYSYYNNENIPAYYFMAIIVALLVGLTVSAEEIFRDQKILKRERFLGLSRLSYLLSKVVILFTISAFQAVLLCCIGNLVLGIPGNFLPFFLVIFSVFCSANLLGLVLSSTFNSPVTIYILIPLVIIPQMLLGGAMFKYSRLNEILGGNAVKVPLVSNFTVSRWAYEGIIVNAFQENKFEKELFTVDKLESRLNYQVSYVVPKLEELIEKRTKQDTLLPPAQKTFLDAVIHNVLREEYLLAAKDFGKIPLGEKQDSLAALKELLKVKYNFILDKKDELVAQLSARGITKEQYSNKNMEEQVTNTLEKSKIVIDSSARTFFQVMDPIYKDPARSRSGLDAHFFSPYKYLWGKEVSTFTYNLLVIWILNFLVFLFLYTDAVKRIFTRIQAYVKKRS